MRSEEGGAAHKEGCKGLLTCARRAVWWERLRRGAAGPTRCQASGKGGESSEK